MKIEAPPKEIAALVLELQGRQKDVQLIIDGKKVAKSAFETTGGRHEGKDN